MWADYDAFAEALYELDKREDVVVTVWQGALCCEVGEGVLMGVVAMGRFFNAYVRLHP